MDTNVVGAYSARQSGPGFEIVGTDGEVVYWAITERTAVVLVSLLNLAHEVGLIDRRDD